jgi:hypothetical protein
MRRRRTSRTHGGADEHRWTSGQAPPGVDVHSPTPLTRIPGTRSLWATGTSSGPKGYYGVILKYGP